LHSDQSEVCELDDEDNYRYDDLTTVDDYVDDKRGVEGLQEGGSDSLSTALSRCAVCQDAASGVHYGVPACEGCKGFFRRIVSSRNIGGACAHSVPLEMTPQTRNTCQWCRLKKCCAVNMGRQRSKLGRRAKLRLRGASSAGAAAVVAPSDDQIMLPGCQSAATQLSGITDQHLLDYIDQKRREFESQVSRRSCFRKEPVVKTQQQQKQQQQQPPPPPSLLEGRLSGRQVASQLMQQGAGSGGVGPLTYPSPPEPVTPPTPPHWQQTPASVKCLKLISRQGTGWRSSMPDAASSSNSPTASCSGAIPIPGANRSVAGSPASAPAVATPDTARAPKKVWLEKSCLMATPLAMICRRLAGPQRAAELEDLHNTLSFNNSVSHLILTAIDKFVGYWEADLNSQFAGNPACGDVIAENTRLILEGHRQTFYFTQNRMRQFMNDRLAQLQEPSPADEGVVLHTLVDYIPQLMLRIVAFSRNIFGGTSSHSMPEPAPQQQQHFETHRDRVSVSSCSDALTDSDKKRLIVQHSFKLVGMRFCASLVQSQQDFIIDPTMRFRLTRRFLQSAGHPMLSQLFLKFFDVSRKWDSLRIEENEMAFLSAFCLTSPYIGIQYPEDLFHDLSSVISVHSAVIGLFWIYLRSKDIAMRGWTADMLASDPWLNLTVRLAATKRLLELSAVFPSLLSVDGLHKQNAAMIESVIEKLNTSSMPGASLATAPGAAGVGVDGFPDFAAPYNPVGARPDNAGQMQQFGAGVYKEVFRG
ncbi:hypothetical protein BOX15_Mlig030316g1, partial [Macrostomum lignano]